MALTQCHVRNEHVLNEYYMLQASGKRMLAVSRLAVLGFALFAGVWSIVLVRIGIDINWLFFVIGLLVASVFPPISFLLTWNAVPRARVGGLRRQCCNSMISRMHSAWHPCMYGRMYMACRGLCTGLSGHSLHAPMSIIG